MPSWKEKENLDEAFMKAVNFIKQVLQREILRAEHSFEAEKFVLEAYEKSEDKRIVVIDKEYQLGDEDVSKVLFEKPEVLFSIRYRAESDNWSVKGIRIKSDDFPVRKQFPAEWGGLRDEDLQKVSGVSDAVFCHRGLFMAVSKSFEGAMNLAKKAIEN
jgi:uncharacterized UPF0160 family protein